MQTCYHCGKQVEDNVLICPECGALVKRYHDAPEQPQTKPAQNDAQNKWVQTTQNGSLRLHGLVKACVIFGIVYSAVNLISFGMMFVVDIFRNHFYAMIDEMMTMPEYAAMGFSFEGYGEMIRIIVATAEQYRGLIIACMVLCALKIAVGGIFLAKKTKWSFFADLGICVAITVLMSVGGMSTLAVALEGIVLAVLLRKEFHKLR